MENVHLGERAPSHIPTVDLNELLFSHPAASFVFQLGPDLIIVDQAITPTSDSLVLAEHPEGLALEIYSEQVIFGVVTFYLKKLT